MSHPPWILIHPRIRPENLGFLPEWLDDADPSGAAEQLDGHYHYGGFSQYPFTGFTGNAKDFSLSYPGDPTFYPLAATTLREETICLYLADIVAVWQKDGSFVAARFD